MVQELRQLVMFCASQPLEEAEKALLSLDKANLDSTSIMSLRTNELHALELAVEKWQIFEKKLAYLAISLTKLKAFFPDFFNKVVPSQRLMDLEMDKWNYLINQLS